MMTDSEKKISDKLLNEELKRQISRWKYDMVANYPEFSNGILIQLMLSYNSKWIYKSKTDNEQRLRILHFIRKNNFILAEELGGDYIMSDVQKARYFYINVALNHLEARRNDGI